MNKLKELQEKREKVLKGIAVATSEQKATMEKALAVIDKQISELESAPEENEDKKPKKQTRVHQVFETDSDFETEVIGQLVIILNSNNSDVQGIIESNNSYQQIISDAFADKKKNTKKYAKTIATKISKDIMDKAKPIETDEPTEENYHGFIIEDGGNFVIFTSGSNKFEVTENENGKWKVAVSGVVEKDFDSKEDAVKFVKKTIYSGVLKDFIDKKEKKIKDEKERQKSRKKAGKPAIKTATETTEDALDTSVDKIEQKLDDGKDVGRDISGMIKQMSDTVEKFVTFVKEKDQKVDKAKVRSLISQLEKLL